MAKKLGVRNAPTTKLIKALQSITDARARVQESRRAFDQSVLAARKAGATWGQLEAARLGLPNPEHVTEGEVGSTSPARQVIARLEREAAAKKNGKAKKN
jgi:hypothetical protein